MKILTSKVKHLLFMGCALLFTNQVSADHWCCYEGPLDPCHFRLGVRGGGSPIWYTDSTRNLLIGDDNPNGVVGTSSVPDFDDQFCFPWTVGAHVGYNYSDQIEVFIDGEYTRATGDTFRTTSNGVGIAQPMDSYSHWSLYAGARYFFCGGCFCGWRYSPFIGAKLGAKTYSEVKFKEDITIPGVGVISFGKRDFYLNYTVPSLGGQFGVEVFINECLSLSFMLETIYSGQLRSEFQSTNGGPAGAGNVQTVSIGDTGPLFTLPFTIGLNYTL